MNAPSGMPPVERRNDPLCAAGEDVAILFSRAPVPGRVKTRLIERLTAEQACALHIACTADVASLLDQALPTARKWLFWSESPDGDNPLTGLDLPPSFKTALQSGLDLGERMSRVLERALVCGAARVLLIGSDSPTLPQRYLERALQLLENYDLLLGPSEDGGFYLIACRRFDRGLFDGVQWGAPEVCEQTRANAARLGYSLGNLPVWFDLDTWSDVERLLANARRGGPLPAHLAEFFSQLQAAGGM